MRFFNSYFFMDGYLTDYRFTPWNIFDFDQIFAAIFANLTFDLILTAYHICTEIDIMVLRYFLTIPWCVVGTNHPRIKMFLIQLISI